MLLRISINNKIKKIALPLLALLLLSACNPPKTQISKHQLLVFGTLVDINVWHHDNHNPQPAIDEISQTFNAMHHQWHAWKPGRLTNINQALRAGKSIRLTAEEAQFITTVILLARQSNHFFNPAIGELIHLWGFHADDYPLLTPPPEMAQIRSLTTQQLNVDQLQLNGLTLSSNNPHIWLDFGGVAKGYAVDLAVKILQKHQFNNAIINAGGDLRSIGSKGQTPWRVAIQSPADWSMLAEIVINGDESVFTSGNYRRYKEFDGQRYSHIINPNSGMPVADIVSATVIAKNGTLADAAATAMIVAGDQWPKIAAQMKLNQVLIINEQLQCFTTSAMLSRLENLHINCQVIAL